MRKKRALPLLTNIPVTDLAAEGKAIARYNDMVVFIPFAAPGDIVDIQVTKKRRNYMEGRVTEFRKLSENRVVPFCSHFGVCGGCKWQHITYEEQLKFKKRQVADHFKRIGKLDIPKIEEVLPSANREYYRNKLEFTFTNRRWLTQQEIDTKESISEFGGAGFHIPGRFDKVLDIEKCYLQSELSDKIRVSIKEYAFEKGLEFFDLVKQEGLLRTLIIRTSSTGELMVVVVFFRNDSKEIEELLGFLAGKFPEINSLMYIVNPKANDTISDLDVILYRGKDYINEAVEGLKFKVGPKSFYQTNSKQTIELYKKVREFADPKENQIIYDLYTGTGTIALFLSGSCKQVIGLEYVPEAVEDARYNAGINNVLNSRFYSGDIKELLTPEFISENGTPDTVITDPPRTGMHPDVVNKLIEMAPSKIVYVSCNSATQARDISLLSEMYTIERMQPVDMFPHTHHIENIALLVKKQLPVEQ